MANQLFAGFVLTDAGVAVSGATVDLLDRNTTTPVRATTTTDANGYFAISHATEGRFDVRITNGSSVRWRKYDTSQQMTAVEVQTLRVRNPAFTFDYDIVPAAIAADRQLNLPLITGTDTLATLGLAQTFTGIQTFNANTFISDTRFVVIGHSATLSWGAGGAATLGVHGTGVSDSSAHFSRWSADSSTPALVFTKSRGASIGTNGIVSDGDALGRVRFHSDDGTDVQSESAAIQAEVDGTPGVNDTPGRLQFLTTSAGGVSATERMRITSVGNIKIAGTASRATTEGTNHLDIFDGTAPIGTLANGISLYSTAGELRVMDAAGNATLLSPHAKNGEWIYDSVNTVTGKKLKVQMERLVKAIDQHFGWGFVSEEGDAE